MCQWCNQHGDRDCKWYEKVENYMFNKVFPTPEEQAMRDEKDAVLWKAISKLSDRHRIPLVLRYFNDFSISEIAEILGLPEGTIHSRLHIARERLRLALEKGRD